MPDSTAIEAEPARQSPFIIPALLTAAMFLTVLAFDRWLLTVPDRQPQPPARAALRFEPVEVRSPPGLRVAGAWHVTSSDPRFGGISALAFDGSSLVALTDSGVVIRFRPPSEVSRRAELRDVPAGPGSAGFKRFRDTEALLRDPQGRGWWVAFERNHQLWLYDPGFRRPLRRLELPAADWRVNGGVEALASVNGGLLLFPESLEGALKLTGTTARFMPVRGLDGDLTAATALDNGSILGLERKPTLLGFRNRLVWLRREGAGYSAIRAIPLPLGPLANAEGLALEPWPAGWSRLWVITDDNFQPPLRTLLVAIDLPPQ